MTHTHPMTSHERGEGGILACFEDLAEMGKALRLGRGSGPHRFSRWRITPRLRKPLRMGLEV